MPAKDLARQQFLSDKMTNAKKIHVRELNLRVQNNKGMSNGGIHN
jgi:hypothetical protein